MSDAQTAVPPRQPRDKSPKSRFDWAASAYWKIDTAVAPLGFCLTYYGGLTNGHITFMFREGEICLRLCTWKNPSSTKFFLHICPLVCRWKTVSISSITIVDVHVLSYPMHGAQGRRGRWHWGRAVLLSLNSLTLLLPSFGAIIRI